jgi:hypothetical protein
MALPSQLPSFSDREAHLTIQALQEEILNYILKKMKILVGWWRTKVAYS